MKYRPEIDGLRALAVIVVILFHAEIGGFSGGFVGVDVFFVISGYLITTIILTEMEDGHFSLIHFYERRARRILPPLFLVTLLSALYAWFTLLPSDMKNFFQSLSAVSTFSSNILFWKTAGYWETSSELNPLLHTWSLAVEEQYYLLFPIFLMIMKQFQRRWISISLVVIAALSLSVAQWTVYQSPIAAFYLLPMRLWELAIGAGTAILFLHHNTNLRKLQSFKTVSELLALSGVAMIFYAVFVFDEATPFPSLFALIPTIGTGLIILFSSSQTLIGRLLGARPLVAIGLVSYSAYLWHQPMFAFARYQGIADNGWGIASLTIFSFALAFPCWRYIEKPFRDKNIAGRMTVFLFAAAGSFIFLAIGLIGNHYNGFEDRLTSEQKELMAFDQYPISEIYRERSCLISSDQSSQDFLEYCFFTEDYDSTILIWGDSHAGALSYGLRKIHPAVLQLTSSGCPPLIGYDAPGRVNCLETNNFVLGKIGEVKPKTLLLLANWSDTEDRIGVELKDLLSTTVLLVKQRSPETDIFIIGGLPQWKPSLPIVLLRSQVKLSDEAHVYSSGFENVSGSDILINEAAMAGNARFISVIEMYCQSGFCLSSVKLNDEYEPFAWDYGHLTQSSSILLAERIINIIDSDSP